MTKEEALKMAKVQLLCVERDLSGTDDMCIHWKCEECSLIYELGGMRERKEWLRLVVETLEQPDT